MVEEERSRFEKWWTAELPGKSWTSADIDNMELAWLAALDDRQEAAPGFMDLIRKWRASADKSERHLGGNDSAENETHMRDMRVCADELEAILPTTGDCGRQEAAPEVMRCENCEAALAKQINERLMP